MSSVQDKDIYKTKLSEIGTAALEASEYITDLIAQLEVNNEEARVNELLAIKNEVVQAVKKNEKEVKAEMQRILDAAAAAAALAEIPDQNTGNMSNDQVPSAGARGETIKDSNERIERNRSFHLNYSFYVIVDLVLSIVGETDRCVQGYFLISTIQ